MATDLFKFIAGTALLIGLIWAAFAFIPAPWWAILIILLVIGGMAS